MLASRTEPVAAPAVQEVAPPPAPKQASKKAPEPAPEPQEVASAPAPKAEKKAPAETKASSAEEEKRRSAIKDGLGGRMLSEDEW